MFIQENAFENVVWNMAPFCLSLNVLICINEEQPSWQFEQP